MRQGEPGEFKFGFRLRKRYPDFVQAAEWAHHCYFVVHDKFGGWWYGSPANGSYTEHGYGGDLRRVLDSMLQEGGLWSMAGYIRSLERQGWLGMSSWLPTNQSHLHYATWRMEREEKEELVRIGVTGVRVPVVVREAAGNQEKQYVTYYPVYFE